MLIAEEFTQAPMRRLIRKHGDLRISEGAVEELRRVVGDYGSKVAKIAVTHALSEGRRTVLDRDIRVARLLVEGGEEKP
jgi:histone H3/H4